MSGLPRRADVVVVGAGTAGCIVAERLSLDGSRSVLLVDEGPGWPEPSDLAIERLPIDSRSSRVRFYDTAQGFTVPRGCGFGGSAAVNGGYFMRWHRDDFTGWPDAHSTWSMEAITEMYDVLDGGRAGGGVMSVDAVGDGELSPTAAAVESYWRRAGWARNDAPWPAVGVNRVRANRAGGLRMTTLDALLGPVSGRPNLQVVPNAPVDALVVTAGQVCGVAIGTERITCGEVILCAGTLGTAGILQRTAEGVAALAGLLQTGLYEHRERLVRCKSRVPAEQASILLPTVLHTDKGVEIRCYNDDLANHINGIKPTGQMLGVATMHPIGSGSVTAGLGGSLRVDLGEPSSGDQWVMDRWCAEVADMLRDGAFADLVDPDSVAVDEMVGTSQHAWGSLPMGERTDALGALDGVRGLRVVDGSILPTAGSSGPHETIAMVALRIANLIA